MTGSVNQQQISELLKDATEKRDEELAKTKIEYRIRIFKYIDTEYVEVTMKEHNKNRVALNHDDEWIVIDENKIYDRYVLTKEYYHYEDIEI